MITVTEEAVNQLRALLESKGLAPGEAGLRLAVEKGGCAGMQYTMRVTVPESTDRIIDTGGVKLFLDASSEPFLQGCAVDYEDSLTDAGFKIHNPNAARSCGCGSSFELST